MDTRFNAKFIVFAVLFLTVSLSFAGQKDKSYPREETRGVSTKNGPLMLTPKLLLGPKVVDEFRRELPTITETDSTFCGYATADELLASCPTQAQIRTIRNDFNISFKQELVDNGILVPWRCTEGGTESSLMLSVYNTFRLAKCIPFERPLSWSPTYDNLYEWLKDIDLVHIGYFFANDASSRNNANSSAKEISLVGNNLVSDIYRLVIDRSHGVGLINAMDVLVHEAAHIATDKGHTCGGGNDISLEYGGAWSVVYYLQTMLATETGDYFSEYQKNTLADSARRTLSTRFCE